MSEDLLINVPAWTVDDTEKWLSLNPLPQDFTWPHRDKAADGTDNLQPVLPSYRLHKGYGFWLRTTPYFPGLFEAIHSELMAVDILPDPADLSQTLKKRRNAQATLFT